jgi:NAD(P)-dependent dehydrogenase (short-subunit alcohol dehydrogenase family)
LKTIIITGANSGIGYETAKSLAQKGNLVIAASRDREDTREKVENLNRICRESNSEGKVVFYNLDLADLQAVREFIAKVTSDFPVIDTLICNAGIMKTPYQRTVDGFEMQFQVNFLGHFMISHGIKNNLLQSANPKIINICSASAEKGQIDTIEALQAISMVSEDEYDGMTSYRESKLAQQISVMELSRQKQNEKIKYSLVHPGIVNTNLFYRNSGRFYKLFMLPFVYLGYALGFFKTPKQGAESSVFLSETKDYESGLYWHKQKNLIPNPITNNQDYSSELLNWSMEKITTKS